MPIIRSFAAAVVLSVLSATTAPAQQVISEPGYCAFFYPNANCQNKGPGNPYTDPNWRSNGAWGSSQWQNTTVPPAPTKRTRRSHASARMGSGECTSNFVPGFLTRQRVG
jgi:hypothetical protein